MLKLKRNKDDVKAREIEKEMDRIHDLYRRGIINLKECKQMMDTLVETI